MVKKIYFQVFRLVFSKVLLLLGFLCGHAATLTLEPLSAIEKLPFVRHHLGLIEYSFDVSSISKRGHVVGGVYHDFKKEQPCVWLHASFNYNSRLPWFDSFSTCRNDFIPLSLPKNHFMLCCPKVSPDGKYLAVISEKAMSAFLHIWRRDDYNAESLPSCSFEIGPSSLIQDFYLGNSEQKILIAYACPNASDDEFYKTLMTSSGDLRVATQAEIDQQIKVYSIDTICSENSLADMFGNTSSVEKWGVWPLSGIQNNENFLICRVHQDRPNDYFLVEKKKSVFRKTEFSAWLNQYVGANDSDIRKLLNSKKKRVVPVDFGSLKAVDHKAVWLVRVYDRKNPSQFCCYKVYID